MWISTHSPGSTRMSSSMPRLTGRSAPSTSTSASMPALPSKTSTTRPGIPRHLSAGPLPAGSEDAVREDGTQHPHRLRYGGRHRSGQADALPDVDGGGGHDGRARAAPPPIPAAAEPRHGGHPVRVQPSGPEVTFPDLQHADPPR